MNINMPGIHPGMCNPPNINPTTCTDNGLGAINHAKRAQISQIGLTLRNFVNRCDTAICSLNTAYNIENLDASTNNNSIFGYCISSASHSRNIDAATQLDALQYEAIKINDMVLKSGIFGAISYGFIPLPTDFSGHVIRQSEYAEHNWFADLFTSNAYSSMASTNTMQQLALASSRVQAVRMQAVQLLQNLQMMSIQ